MCIQKYRFALLFAITSLINAELERLLAAIASAADRPQVGLEALIVKFSITRLCSTYLNRLRTLAVLFALFKQVQMLLEALFAEAGNGQGANLSP